MATVDIQRQYNEVIAPHYDLDPQCVTGGSQSLALAQLQKEGCLSQVLPPFNVLDVGVGTGVFLERLRSESSREIRPHGLDISSQMLDVARNRIPDLISEIDDAAHLARHFESAEFDLICTHFVTGFVPLCQLAPVIFSKLKPGGYWSFVGGTSGGFPELQRVARSAVVRTLFFGHRLDLSGLITPEDRDEVVQVLTAESFEICEAVTFEPSLQFQNYDAFMDFAWRGGWLTPLIETLRLQNAGQFVQGVLNSFVFPVSDCHCIVIALARKPLVEHPGI